MIDTFIKNPRQDFFDKIATNWGNRFKAEDETFIRSIISKSNTLGLESKKVLDLGCGCGALFPFLKDYEVVAFDISGEMLKQARLRGFQNVVEYVQGDAHHLPFPSNYFAKVFMLSVFPHFDNPQKVLKEIHRVLKLNGSGILIHLEDINKINAIHQSIGGPIKNDKLPTPEQLINLIKNSGFNIIYENFDKRVAIVFNKSTELPSMTDITQLHKANN